MAKWHPEMYIDKETNPQVNPFLDPIIKYAQDTFCCTSGNVADKTSADDVPGK